MTSKLDTLCAYAKSKVAVDTLTVKNYVSTENMIPDKCGITDASSLPSVQYTQQYLRDDVLVSNIRPYFKKIWKAEYDGGCSNDVLVFRAKDNCDPTFLFYLLADDNFFNYATATAKGTKMPRGDKSAIMQYDVPAFDIDTQQKIGALLWSIDQKIRLNNQINENLQQQAQTIFTNMFETEDVVLWKSGTLSDIAEITMGQSPSGNSYNEDGQGTVFFQGRAEFGFRFPTVRLFTTEPKRMALKNDILMSVRAPVGDLNVAHEDCCVGRGLAAIRSKDNHQSFVHYTMFSLQKELNVFNGEGTVFGSINRNSLNAMPIKLPPQKLIDEFEDLVAPIDALILSNHDETCRLKAIRDTLLPRLLYGELDIADLDI